MGRTKTKPFLKRKKVPKFYFHFGQQKQCPPFSFKIYLAMWKYNCEPLCLQKMLDAGVIQPSISEWASAPVLIRKRDGGVRWCIDYRALNTVTVKDVFPLPLIEECLYTLAGNIWYSKLDANSAYWQVGIKPEDRKKTAFTTKFGLFECVKMSFGLCNAPGTYARVMNL